MKNRYRIETFIMIPLAFFTMGIFLYYTLIYRNIYVLVLFTILCTVLLSYFTFRLYVRTTPRAYNVAIIGFPKSGKTTLITSVFREIFASRIVGFRASLRGNSTIERVNENIEKLEKGISVGPTYDQTKFSYSTNVEIKRGIFPLYYKVEFGDFPGNDSEIYMNKYGDWLHKTEFFQWVMDCDALIFVIDLAEYLKNYKREKEEYTAKISKAIRAAWQYYYEYNNERSKSLKLRRRPIVLCFTKTDSFDVYYEYRYSNEEVSKELEKYSFGNEVPSIHEISPRVFEEGEVLVKKDFNDLIRYFESESNNFHFIFTSCFGTKDGKKLGIQELISLVLH
jgi:GTPase SAR1 family protein